MRYISTMLKTWRIENGLTLAQAADRLGLIGAGAATAYQRYETGRHRADADLVEKIAAMTAGIVGPSEMHAIRLRYLREAGRIPAEDVE